MLDWSTVGGKVIRIAGVAAAAAVGTLLWYERTSHYPRAIDEASIMAAAVERGLAINVSNEFLTAYSYLGGTRTVTHTQTWTRATPPSNIIPGGAYVTNINTVADEDYLIVWGDGVPEYWGMDGTWTTDDGGDTFYNGFGPVEYRWAYPAYGEMYYSEDGFNIRIWTGTIPGSVTPTDSMATGTVYSAWLLITNVTHAVVWTNTVNVYSNAYYTNTVGLYPSFTNLQKYATAMHDVTIRTVLGGWAGGFNDWTYPPQVDYPVYCFAPTQNWDGYILTAPVGFDPPALMGDSPPDEWASQPVNAFWVPRLLGPSGADVNNRAKFWYEATGTNAALQRMYPNTNVLNDIARLATKLTHTWTVCGRYTECTNWWSLSITCTNAAASWSDTLSSATQAWADVKTTVTAAWVNNTSGDPGFAGQYFNVDGNYDGAGRYVWTVTAGSAPLLITTANAQTNITAVVKVYAVARKRTNRALKDWWAFDTGFVRDGMMLAATVTTPAETIPNEVDVNDFVDSLPYVDLVADNYSTGPPNVHLYFYPAFTFCNELQGLLADHEGGWGYLLSAPDFRHLTNAAAIPPHQ